MDNNEKIEEEKLSVAESSPPLAAEDKKVESNAELEQLRAEVAKLNSELADLGSQFAELKDKYMRSLADSENFRKRMFRERDDSLKYAAAGLMADLVPIIDNFDRAIGSSEQKQDFKILYDGIIMVRKDFLQLLTTKYNMQIYGKQGDLFDPSLFEAYVSEEAAVAEPTIAEVFLPGYRLHERVLRTGKVKVQMPAQAQAAPAGPVVAEGPLDAASAAPQA